MRFLFLITILSLTAVPAAAQTDTTITYQGQLQDAGGPFTGTPGMEFRLFDSLVDGNQIGTEIILSAVPITDGLFQVDLDFGAQYGAEPTYLEVMVGGEVLAPRQKISAAPLAIHALSLDTAYAENHFWKLGGNADTTPGTDILGTTDNSPLELRVNGQRALRLEPGIGVSPNVIAGSAYNEVASGVIGASVAGGAGGSHNVVTDDFGTIGGGRDNQTGSDDGDVFSQPSATVGGGSNNTASNTSAMVGGGSSNTASAARATVSGGSSNTASGSSATVGGGSSNTASNTSAMVGGGSSNTASAARATVSGGYGNTASGTYATVPGGRLNEAAGIFSLAAGRRAKANHYGAFVWADSTNDDFASTDVNQFLVRAGGGVGINADAPVAALHVESAVGEDGLRVRIDESTGLRIAANRGVSVGTALFAPDQGLRVSGLVELNGLGAGGTELCITSGNIVSDCTTSSRRFKENIQSLSRAKELIEQLGAVRFDWKKTGEADIGLIAEEVAEVEPDLVTFHDDGEVRGVKYRQLSVVLISAMQEQQAEIESWRQEALDRLAALESENARLQLAVDKNTQIAERNRELEQRLAALEAVLLEDEQVARQAD